MQERISVLYQGGGVDPGLPVSVGPAVAPSATTHMEPSASCSKLGAKPRPQATSTPEGREPVTRSREGDHGRKLLHTTVEVKASNNFSIPKNPSQLGGPGTCTSIQGSGGPSPPALEKSTPVGICGTQSALIYTCNRTVNVSSCATRTTPHQTTSTCSTWTTEVPAAATPLHTPELPLPAIAEIDGSGTDTTKPYQVGTFLNCFQWVPALFEMATEKKKPNKTSHVLEDGGVQLNRCGHTVKMEEHIIHIRSALNKQEEELKSVQQEANEMKRHYEDQLQRLSSALHQKQQEIQTFTERGHGDEQQLQTRMLQMENYYKQELHKMSSALFEKGKEADFYKHSVSERENYLQRKLEETRSILQQKDEELKSFKDRVAGEVALSIKTGKTESMNNPVSKNRLKEMYNDLRVLWPTIKNHLRSNSRSPESVKALLQRIFTAASEEMEQQKSLIDQMFGLNESDGRPIPQKVNEYRKATIQYLQLTLFYNRKDEAESKMASLPDEGNLEVVMDFLDSHCQWLGKLMALNDPPLQPDWENHDPGMNVWDILPRNISSSTSL